MRKLLILLVFLLCSCSAAQKKFLHPTLTLPQFDVCLIDTQFPAQLYCKNVFNYDGKPHTYNARLKSQKAWMAMTVDDFKKLVAFMRMYCAENKRACGKLAKQLRRYEKRR